MREELVGFLRRFENFRLVRDDEVAINCIYCGRSKHNKPHLYINLEHLVFNCFRCGENGRIYRLLVDMDAPAEILSLVKRKGYIHSNLVDKGYSIKVVNINRKPLSEECLEYIRGRGIGDEVIERVNITGITERSFAFYSYYGNFFYTYSKEGDLWKKSTLKAVKNTKVIDYFFIEEGEEMLFISEGVFDALTLYQSGEFNASFLSVGGKNMRRLKTFLFSTGNLFFKDVVLVLDNDVSEERFIDTFLRFNRNIFDNLYVLRVDPSFVDVNEMFVKTGKLEFEIKRVL